MPPYAAGIHTGVNRVPTRVARVIRAPGVSRVRPLV